MANVIDFGAVPSGSNSDADQNTAAFDACVASLKRAGGGEMFIPAGVYYKGPTLIMDAQNIHIRGAGRSATKIVQKDSPASLSGPVFHFGDGVSPTRNCSLSAMEMDGNLANQMQSATPGESNTGLVIQLVDGFNGFDLCIHDCDGYGIGMSGTGRVPRQDVNIRNVEVYCTNADGIDIKGGAQRFFLDDIRVHDTVASPRGADAMGIDIRGQRINLSNFWVWNISTSKPHPGVRVRAETGGTFQDEINVSNGFVFDCPRGYGLAGGDDTRANLTNCWAMNTTSYGMEVSGGAIVLNGCHVHSAGSDGMRINPGGRSLVVFGGSFNDCSLDGIRRYGGARLEMHGVDILGNARHGANIDGAGSLAVFGGRIAGNGSGLVLDGVTDKWLLAGGKIVGNQESDILYSGVSVAGQILSTEYAIVSGTEPAGTYNTQSQQAQVADLLSRVTALESA